MKHLFKILAFLLLLSSCKDKDSTPKSAPALNESEKLIIQEFAKKLESDLNQYQYKLMKQSWNSDQFVKRIGQLNKTQRVVFNTYWEDEWEKEVMYTNVDLINLIKFNNGRAELTQLEDLGSHFDLKLAFIINEVQINFIKYRVEFIKGKAALTDLFFYKTENWLSQKIRLNMKLATKYNAFSTERREAYNAMSAYGSALSSGDSLEALIHLYGVPEEYEKVYDVGVLRLNAASFLADSIYYNILYSESEHIKSLYFDYHLAWAEGDSVKIKTVLKDLGDKTGSQHLMDSLFLGKYYWF